MKRIPLVSLRLVREKSVPWESPPITDSVGVRSLFLQLGGDLDREAVWILCLNTKNRPVCISQVSVGSLDSSIVHPREVMKAALLSNASGIIMVHNHPSGDPSPSRDDHLITERIRLAAELIGIRMLDHVIVGGTSSYSFRDAGCLIDCISN